MPRKSIIPAVGDVYGGWTVLGDAERAPSGTIRVLVRCHCGAIHPMSRWHLVHRPSAGCRCCTSGRLKHGAAVNGTLTPEYVAWKEMHSRCSRNREEERRNYQERGINVCEEWSEFAPFFEHMGRKPGPEYSLDRIDNDKGYFPGNCRWATRLQQRQNQRPRRSRGT